MCVFGRLEETRAPKENEENMQTTHRKTPARFEPRTVLRWCNGANHQAKITANHRSIQWQMRERERAVWALWKKVWIKASTTVITKQVCRCVLKSGPLLSVTTITTTSSSTTTTTTTTTTTIDNYFGTYTQHCIYASVYKRSLISVFQRSLWSLWSSSQLQEPKRRGHNVANSACCGAVRAHQHLPLCLWSLPNPSALQQSPQHLARSLWPPGADQHMNPSWRERF